MVRLDRTGINQNSGSIMIGPKYVSFFLELEQNNHRQWFQDNKKRYEADVKGPFLELVGQLIEHISTFEDDISMSPKKTLFRINRDIRFSKDKSPYHLLLKSSIAPGGKKSALPGYYLGISADHIHVGGGLFKVEKDQLFAIRHHILKQRAAFSGIILYSCLCPGCTTRREIICKYLSWWNSKFLQ